MENFKRYEHFCVTLYVAEIFFFYSLTASFWFLVLPLILLSLLISSLVFPGVYSFGLFATTIFANAGQVVTGNQTPHFLSACRPNYTALGCQSPLQYITENRACTGNPFLVVSARKSFPSKDAALSFYSAIYTVVGNQMSGNYWGRTHRLDQFWK